MSEKNVEVVQNLFDAVARGDIEGALGYVRPDGEWVNPDYAMEPGTRRGLSGVRIALTALRDSFAELRFDISEMVDVDDRVSLPAPSLAWAVRVTRLSDPRPSARW